MVQMRISGRGTGFRRSGLLSLFAIAAVELVNTSGNVHQFLFAGEERMAFRADTDSLLFSRGVDFPDLSAGADHLRGTIIRMNSFFHFCKPYQLWLSYIELVFNIRRLQTGRFAAVKEII